MEPISGKSVFGLHANVGYFDQTLTQSFSGETVFADFQKAFPRLNDRETRTALGAFLFSGDDVFKQVKDLSGGEKVRLALCKIFKMKPNILILDEPTNHMDIIGRDTLEQMLSDYKGTVIAVSHDRYFINRICDRLIVFEEGGIRIYEGTYSEYERDKQEKALRDESAFGSEDGSQAPEAAQKKQRPVSASRQKARKEHRLSVLEEKIEVFDRQINEIKEKIADPAYYSSPAALTEFENELARLNEEKAPFEEEWESVLVELEEME